MEIGAFEAIKFIAVVYFQTVDSLNLGFRILSL